MRKWQKVALVVLAALWAYFVWPTPYYYLVGVGPNRAAVRINRVSGHVTVFTGEGWAEK